MADLKLGSQIGGNLIWHQGILELNPSDEQLFYKNQEIITNRGNQTIGGNFTVNGVGILSSLITNIVTLTSKESNELSLINSNTMSNDATITRIVGGITSNWYTDNVSFGNIRSATTNSSGFGAKLNGKWLAHFDRDGLAYIGTGTNETKYRIYHEGFKPVPADVGAQPVNVKLTNFVNSRVDISVSDITIDGKRALTKAVDTSNNTLYVGYASAFSEIDFQSPARFDNMVTDSTFTMHSASPTFTMRDTDARSAFLHTNNSKFYIMRGGVNSTSFDNGPNNRHPMAMDLENGDVYFSGRVFGEGVQLYGPNRKPSNVDLNMVSRAGDTMTGTLQINAGELITDNVGNRMLHSGGSNVVGNTVKDLRLDGGSGSVSITSNRVTSNKDLYVSNNKVYHQGFKPTPNEIGTYTTAEIDAFGTGYKTVTLNSPVGVVAGKYYPILIGGVAGYQDVFIVTSGGGGSDPMNRCSFDGKVRPIGWSDGIAAVDGIFTIYDVNERSIHSIYMPSENDGGYVFYVEARSFPITLKVPVSVSVSCTGQNIVFGTSTFNAGVDSPSGIKIKPATDFNKGSGHYYGNGLIYHEGNRPTNEDLNLVSRAGDTMTGALVINSTLNVSGVATINKVLLSGAQSTEANALTRKDYVDSKVGTAVQSVGATAPLFSSGGANPSISISAATNAAAGSMSAADKAKLDGIPGDALSRSIGGTMTGMLTISRPTGNMSLSMQTPSGWSYLEIKSGATQAHIAQNDTAIEGAASGSLHLRPMGTKNGSLILQPNSAMVHQTTSGYIRIGSLNSTHVHFETDRSSFHFNHNVLIQGEIYTGAGYNKRVFHQGFLPTPYEISAHEVKPWIASPGTNANDTGNYTAFTYSSNAPWAGPIVSMGVNRYTMQFNSRYNGTQDLSFRTHNGDNSTWNPWVTVYTSSNKPTPTDIGALPIGGGNLTGNLHANGGGGFFPAANNNGAVGNSGWRFAEGWFNSINGTTVRADRMVRGFGTSNFFDGAGLETGATTTDPSISFHKEGAYAATLRLISSSNFAFVTQDNSEYADLSIRDLSLTGAMLRPLNVNAGISVNQSDGIAGKGLSLYGVATNVKPSYGMFFGVTSTWGQYGGVTGDWATYFTMEGAVNRGWIFKHAANNISSLSCAGHLTVNNITTGDATNTSWWRTVGDGGWYHSTYGGGIHMSDNTWVRVYGSKKFYVANTENDSIQTSGGIAANRNISAATFSGNGANITNIDWNKITGKPTVTSNWINIFNGGIAGRVQSITIPPQMLNHLNAGGVVDLRVWLNRSGAIASNRKCISQYIDGADGWSSLSTSEVAIDMTWYAVSYLYVYNPWTGHGANANKIVSQYQNIVKIDMQLL